MRTIIELLKKNPQVSDYKINSTNKESYELFFVKGKLETVRRTNTCDKEVTVYVDHEEFKGESQFFVYPSTTEGEISTLIEEAIGKARLINNKTYELPGNEEGCYEVTSNFKDYSLSDLAALVSDAVWKANIVENASLNSVEIFINKYTSTVSNSRNLTKTQIRYSAMLEAIPTYNGASESVELYQQYNFSNVNAEEISREIAEKLQEVSARSKAIKPDFAMECSVILNKEELSQIFSHIAHQLNYGSVYAHSNLFSKGDAIQKAPVGDTINICMAGEAAGCIGSSKFDGDGMTLTDIQIVENGKAINYYGSNRFGQYLGEQPTGNLGCLLVAPGTADTAAFEAGPYLEVVSMSSLQTDFFNDYIGGEIRLAYYHDGTTITPVTGVSISAKVSDVLNNLRLSSELANHNGYVGPKKALLSGVKIF